MAIKIQTKQTFIPVEIGDLKLKFDVSDESLIRLRKKMEEVQNSFVDVESTDSDEEAVEKVKSIVRIAYDELFGEGTFDKVYEISPSTLIVTEYFMQIAQGLYKEMEKRGFTSPEQQKINKYLQNKRNRNKYKRKK